MKSWMWLIVGAVAGILALIGGTWLWLIRAFHGEKKMDEN